MKVVVVVQARTGSTRLPNKVLADVCGGTLLQRMLERVLAAGTPSEVVLATTLPPADDHIRDIGHALDLRVYSGHPTDLLDRHFCAARAARADVVVKIPSDCPLIDPAVIDRVIGAFTEDPERYDFVSNLHPPSWPDGNDVEVMPMAVLERAWAEAFEPHEREHTTPFVWDRPERFRIGNVRWPGGRDLSMSHRWTIDYPEDLAFVRAVYDALWRPGAATFGVDDVLALLDERPAIAALNAHLAGVNWYREHLDALRTVSAADTRLPREPREPHALRAGHLPHSTLETAR